MKIIIEKSKEAGLLAKLNQEVQDLHHKLYPTDFKPFDEENIKRAFEKMLSSSDCYAFHAALENSSVGYALCFVRTRNENEFQYEKTVLLIDQISVLESHRKKGIGKLLLDRCMDLAKELNISEIHLEHWNDNKNAEKFFSSSGFGKLKITRVSRM